MIFLPLSFVLSWLTGYLFVSSFLQPPLKNFWLKVCLAIGVGLGLSSCGFFIWLLIFGSSSNTFVVVDLLLLISSIAFFAYTIKKQSTSPVDPSPNSEGGTSLLQKLRGYWREFKVPPSSPPELGGIEGGRGVKGGLVANPVATSREWSILAAFLLLMAAGFGAFFLLKSFRAPHGYIDAFAIWNMRAKFIFRGGEWWRNAFSVLDWSHPDYPLLLPALVVRFWKYVGDESTIIPIFVALCFTFATIGLLYTALSLLRSKSQALLAAMLLLSTPFFMQNGVNQTADVPISFFFLSTIVLLALNERISAQTGNHSLLFLAGITAGFSAWTKNEGALFLLSILVVTFLAVTARKGWNAAIKQLAPFWLGMLPILLIVFYFKTQLAPDNDILSSERSLLLFAKIIDPARHLKVGQALLTHLFRFNHYSWVVLLLYACLVGINQKIKSEMSVFAITSFILMLIGYYCIYLITPFNLDWHLATSLNRLLLQLWPSVLFVFFLLVNTPEKVMIRSKGRQLT